MICSDPGGLDGAGYYPTREICYVSAAVAAARRRFEKMHEKAAPDDAGFLPVDGVSIDAGLTDEHPEDDFLNGDAVDSMALLVARAKQMQEQG